MPLLIRRDEEAKPFAKIRVVDPALQLCFLLCDFSLMLISLRTFCFQRAHNSTSIFFPFLVSELSGHKNLFFLAKLFRLIIGLLFLLGCFALSSENFLSLLFCRFLLGLELLLHHSNSLHLACCRVPDFPLEITHLKLLDELKEVDVVPHRHHLLPLLQYLPRGKQRSFLRKSQACDAGPDEQRDLGFRTLRDELVGQRAKLKKKSATVVEIPLCSAHRRAGGGNEEVAAIPMIGNRGSAYPPDRAQPRGRHVGRAFRTIFV
ncbi:hypothetical protein B0T16DRAFT_406232 [Cercophora newfieldiana]|uniref:Transmembrane protein n=1 Tax=Cercophora newfieldiana TaxID=92897 RepID=A0AA39YIA6_9PEZI|nr:hypothetical protein B0T16DRAFT_406232 [Cercophora newfieldiana]